ncbi:SAV_2336 N-terminal domain-related protein [Streptomyces sp. NPDC017966]|uniref:SAV_2336 N-terminal domain-related protein n=1 Tax=Streptomyces sp. NPDC017966 TaxID=3365023 RepID=UPI00378F83A6
MSSQVPDALTRLLRTLGPALPPGTDARVVADALWLAASGTLGEHRPPAPPAGPEDAGDQEPGPTAPPGGQAPPDTRTARGRTANRELYLHSPWASTTIPSTPVSLGRVGPLPDSLGVRRALQPFRRPWRHGGLSRLDIDATVEHYARGGPLVPLFRPAPEPWFEAVVIVDTSLSMSVWEETTRAVSGLLRDLGGFRAVRTWHLEWQGTGPRVRDHHGDPVRGDRVPHHGSGTRGRRLVLLISDCAAPGWHTPAPWLLVRAWGGRIPVALLDPLPPRLWRRSALNLPAVRVTCGRTGDDNDGLRFRLPPRLRPRPGEGPTPWSALPVLSCSPRSIGAWASTLMRADPRGCDAVLVPATGRVPRTSPGTVPARHAALARLAEAFVATAPAPAVRLAVLSSGLPELPLPLLHVLRDQVVPEAHSSDLAELLTSGLFTVRREADGDPVLVLRFAARMFLRACLTNHDVWQTLRAFSRHVATHPYAPHGIAAVLHDSTATTELPAELRPFARAVTAIRGVLEPALNTGTEEAGQPDDGAEHRDGRAAGLKLLSRLTDALCELECLEDAQGRVYFAQVLGDQLGRSIDVRGVRLREDVVALVRAALSSADGERALVSVVEIFEGEEAASVLRPLLAGAETRTPAQSVVGGAGQGPRSDGFGTPSPGPLSHEQVRSARTLLSELAEGLSSRELHGRLSDALNGLPLPVGLTVEQLFEHVLDFNSMPDGLPPAVLLMECAAWSVRFPGDRDALLRWTDSWAQGAGLLAELRRRRQDRRTDAGGSTGPHIPLCLVLVVEPARDGTADIVVSTWHNTTPQRWDPMPAEPVITTLDALNHVVEQGLRLMAHLAPPADAALSDTRTPHLYVEFVLPYDLMNHDVAGLMCRVGEGPPIPLGLRHPVHLRSLERMRTDDVLVRSMWQERWSTLGTRGIRTYEWKTSDERRLDAWQATLAGGSDYTAAVLDAPQDTAASEALRAAIAEGVGVALWDRRGVFAEERREVVNAVLASVPRPEQLPTAVHRLRRRALQENSASLLGNHIALLWDDPTRPVDVPESDPAP